MGVGFEIDRGDGGLIVIELLMQTTVDRGEPEHEVLTENEIRMSFVADAGRAGKHVDCHKKKSRGGGSSVCGGSGIGF